MFYLDYAASTPMDSAVIDCMMYHCRHTYANPSATTHLNGHQASQVVLQAQRQVASLIGGEPNSIIFTSGATEANNLAIFGASRAYRKQGGHIISSAVEHSAVLEPIKQLEKQGFEVTYLMPDETGQISANAVADALRPDTILVSIMAVNNELGTCYPIQAIGQQLINHPALLHVDAVQGVGKIPIDVTAMGIDLLSLSGHKLYGPKGIGALYVRPKVKLEAQMLGGRQQKQKRPGTLPTPQIAGLGLACELAQQRFYAHQTLLNDLYHTFVNGLSDIPEVTIRQADQFYPGIVNVTFHQVNSQALMAWLPDVAFSAGSACQAQFISTSHVLSAIGLDDQQASQTVRFSFGQGITVADLKTLVGRIQQAVAQIRAIGGQNDL